MKVHVYPQDKFACGAFRMVWPSETLRANGHDVTIVDVAERELEALTDIHGEVVGVRHVPDVDVIVFQRVTHRLIAGLIKVLRREGIATVVDIDDDLEAIHPSNPAFTMLHPSNVGKNTVGRGPNAHAWTYLMQACREATLVTVTTPMLLERYARHGRGVVLPNYLPAHYYGHERVDSDVIGWPASLHSHPDDPSAVGPAIARLVNAGAKLTVVGDPLFTGRAFGMSKDVEGGSVPMEDYPAAVAKLGIGIAPLADTRFNAAKSWLKPLELSALGVPWVASARVEYDRLHRRGAGLLASAPKDWYRQLKALQESPQMRAELSAAGRNTAEGMKLEDHAWRWMDAWAYARQLQGAKPKRSVFGV